MQLHIYIIRYTWGERKSNKPREITPIEMRFIMEIIPKLGGTGNTK